MMSKYDGDFPIKENMYIPECVEKVWHFLRKTNKKVYDLFIVIKKINASLKFLIHFVFSANL